MASELLLCCCWLLLLLITSTDLSFCPTHNGDFWRTKKQPATVVILLAALGRCCLFQMTSSHHGRCGPEEHGKTMTSVGIASGGTGSGRTNSIAMEYDVTRSNTIGDSHHALQPSPTHASSFGQRNAEQQNQTKLID